MRKIIFYDYGFYLDKIVTWIINVALHVFLSKTIYLVLKGFDSPSSPNIVTSINIVITVIIVFIIAFLDPIEKLQNFFNWIFNWLHLNGQYAKYVIAKTSFIFFGSGSLGDFQQKYNNSQVKDIKPEKIKVSDTLDWSTIPIVQPNPTQIRIDSTGLPKFLYDKNKAITHMWDETKGYYIQVLPHHQENQLILENRINAIDWSTYNFRPIENDH